MWNWNASWCLLAALVPLMCVWSCAGIALRPESGLQHDVWEATESVAALEDPIVTSSSSSRIINGMTAKDVNQFPSVVALIVEEMTEEGDEFYQFCTGSLIDATLVLSAAHCFKYFKPNEVVVCAGVLDLHADGALENCARAKALAVPDEYDLSDDYDSSGSLSHDLAVIQLEKSLLQGDVATVAVTFEVPAGDQVVFTAGYGLQQNYKDDGKLHFIDQRIVPAEDCEMLGFFEDLEDYFEDEDSYFDFDFGIPDAEDLVCADGNYDGSRGSACKGDSGGPLMVLTGDRETDYVVGVENFGVPGAFSGAYRELCDSSFEKGYASLTSDVNKGFIKGAVEELGGTIRTVSPWEIDSTSVCNAPAVEQCMAILNNGCLDSEKPDKSCCTDAYHATDCVKSLIGPCRGTGVKYWERKAVWEESCEGMVVHLTPTASPTPTAFPTYDLTPTPTVSPTPTASPTYDLSPSPLPSPSPSTSPRASPSSLSPPPTACFPSDAKVIVQVAGELRPRAMRDLQVGDSVQTGRHTFSEVFAFTHRTESVESDFVRLVAGDTAVEMSANHYVPVRGRGLVAAGSVRGGDVVELGMGGSAAVESVGMVNRRGLYNPQTMDDMIVVDGVVASTLTQTVHPRVAEWLLVVPKVAYRLGVAEPLGRWLYETMPRSVLWLVPRGAPVVTSL